MENLKTPSYILKANKDFRQRNHQTNIIFVNEKYEEIKKASDALGVPFNTYIRLAIDEKLAREQQK